MIQVPIGLERDHQGAVDVIEREAVYFEGERGETPVRKPVPESLVDQVESCRQELVETLAEVDDKIEEFFLMGEEVPAAVSRGRVVFVRMSVCLSVGADVRWCLLLSGSCVGRSSRLPFVVRRSGSSFFPYW